MPGPCLLNAVEHPLQLLIVGDVMLGRGVNSVLEHEPPEYPWGDTLPVFQHADWRICNLECVLSDRGKPWAAYEKAFHFRSAARNLAALTAASVNAVSLANNHVLDYGEEALLQMLEVLDEAKIAYSGAGVDIVQASQMAVAETQGRRLGLMAFTDNEPPWEATPHHPGIFYVPVDLSDARAQGLFRMVRERSATVDLLIVSAHWGGNWGYTPPKEHIEFAHALIDAGAGLVFGHSSHVFRGIEFYQDRPVLYGVGDFVDDYAVDEIERNDQSFIFTVDLDKKGPCGLRLYPTVIRRCQAAMAEGGEARRIARKMEELCAPFHAPIQWNEGKQCLETSGSFVAVEKSYRT